MPGNTETKAAAAEKIIADYGAKKRQAMEPIACLLKMNLRINDSIDMTGASVNSSKILQFIFAHRSQTGNRRDSSRLPYVPRWQ